MKRIQSSLFILVFFINNGVSAQDFHTIYFDIDNIQPLVGVNCVIDSVVDLRMNKFSTGFINKGLGNVKVPAITQKPLKFEINNIINQYFKNINSTNHYILVINKFEISERITSTTENAFLDIEYSVWERKEDESIFVLKIEGEKQTKQGELDVTTGHPKRIIKGILMELSQSNLNFNLKTINQFSELFTVDTNENVSNGRFNLNKGAFIKFNNLKYNQPDTTFFIKNRVIYENNGIYSKIVSNEDKKYVKGLYGFYDGDNLYVCRCNYQVFTGVENKIYVKASEIGKYILIKDELADASGVVASGLSFGLVGVHAFTALSDVSEGIILDTKTGAFIPASKSNVFNILSEFPNLANKYKKLPNINYDVNYSFIMSLNSTIRNK